MAPLVVWLCADAVSNVNGRTFLSVAMRSACSLSPKSAASAAPRDGDLETLDSYARERLIGDLIDNFTLVAYPELKRFG